MRPMKSRGSQLSILNSDEIVFTLEHHSTQLPQTNYGYQPMDRIKDVRALVYPLSMDMDLTLRAISDWPRSVTRPTMLLHALRRPRRRSRNWNRIS